MKVFLTGATGYIGNSLLVALLGQNQEVHAICRNLKTRQLMQHSNLKWFEGDLLNIQSLQSAMEGCEAVYHTAAYVRAWSKDPGIYFQQNVTGTVNVLNLAVKNNIRKVVMTSTAGIISPSGKKPSNESELQNNSGLNEYETSKLMAEEKVFSFAAKGLQVVILNPSRVYGPGKLGKSNVLTQMIYKLMQKSYGFIPGDGKAIGSYCFIDDVVNGHMLAMEKGRSGERYILGGENVSYNDLAETILNQLPKKKIIHVPVSAIRMISGVEYLRAKLFKHEPWIIPKWVDRYFMDRKLDSGKAISELGYRITPLSSGIRKTIDWLQEEAMQETYNPTYV